MFIHSKKIFFFIFLFYLNTNSQIIQKIEVKGVKIFTEKDYLEWINIYSGSPFFEGIYDTIKNRISANLKVQGYFNFKIDSVSYSRSDDSSKINIKLFVDEENPTFYRKTIIEKFDSSASGKLLANFDMLSEKIFSQSSIDEAINDILFFYEENGFPFVKVKITSINFLYDSSANKNYADLYLKIEKGIESKISSIDIVGNDNTKDFVIEREINVKIGERYSQNKIDNIPKKLNRLRYFEPVSEPIFLIDSKDQGVLQINVKEKSTNNFDGVIGFIPSSKQDESGYLTGLINVSLRNLFGTGRAFAVRWQKIDKFSQELELKYLEPYFFDFPFNIYTSLYQKKQDTSFVHRKIDAAIEYIAADDFTISLLLSTEAIIPTMNEYSVFTVYNSSLLSTGFNFKYDSRDEPYSPSEGFYLLSSYSFSQKKINGPEQYFTSELERKINLQKLALDFNFYYRIFFTQIIAFGIHAKEINGTMLEISDLFFLGGANSLRGYRENQFQGSRIIWTNLEYRLLLTRRTFTFLFFDTGYYLRKADDKRNLKESAAFKYGYGLGLNLETGLGILSVSFALGKEDSFSDGKIHFGLINEF